MKIENGQRIWFRDVFEIDADEFVTICVVNDGPGQLHVTDEDGTGYGPCPPKDRSLFMTSHHRDMCVELFRGSRATVSLLAGVGQWEYEDFE